MKERYFSHDANARSDGKIIKLRMKWGMEGYGIYFALLEMLYGEKDYALPYTDEQFAAVAYELRTDVNVSEMMAYCVDIGLFETDGNTFWSESFRRRMEEMTAKAYERSEKASNAALARWGKGRVNKVEPEKPSERPSEEPSPFSWADVPQVNDPDYSRFAKEFHKQIGDMPIGNLLEELNCFYDEFGVDIMIEVVKAVNKAAPQYPRTRLMNELRGLHDAGVKTVDEAVAYIKNHDRNAHTSAKAQQTERYDPLAGTPFTR